jgi:glucosamine--fructose-6-phosphate aminotransferase (isomerizing)
MPENASLIEGQYLRDLLEQPLALQNTLDALRASKTLEQLALRLNDGNFSRIVLTGMGSSFHVLHPLNLALIERGFTPIMLETAELVHYGKRLVSPETLIVAVSQSGHSAEMIHLLEINGQQRSPIIAVTNTETSPLASDATAVVLTHAGREFSVSCKTYVTALMALEWLSGVLCRRSQASMNDDWNEIIPFVEEYLKNWKEHVSLLMQELTDVSPLFLIGRGASLATAGTGALIIKESAHFHAEGMSSAAFRHGPREMLDERAFVLIFAGDDRTRDLNDNLAEDIRRQKARAEVVSESSRATPFRLPMYRASANPILEILPVQMITLALAALAGREAGKFERATKITATE